MWLVEGGRLRIFLKIPIPSIPLVPGDQGHLTITHSFNSLLPATPPSL